MNHLLKEFAKDSQDKTPMPDGLAAQQADSEAMGRETGALCCLSRRRASAGLLPCELRGGWAPASAGSRADPDRASRAMWAPGC